MGDEVGVRVTEKEARDMLRKYGNRKQILNIDDCLHHKNKKKKK